MSCIPQSGGCERPFTEAFVEHLNQTGGSRYVHRACLDRIDSKNPQPEAMYVDSERKLQLVIERKSISWPIDYPYRQELWPRSRHERCERGVRTAEALRCPADACYPVSTRVNSVANDDEGCSAPVEVARGSESALFVVGAAVC